MPLHHRVAAILSSSPQLEEPQEIARCHRANLRDTRIRSRPMMGHYELRQWQASGPTAMRVTTIALPRGTAHNVDSGATMPYHPSTHAEHAKFVLRHVTRHRQNAVSSAASRLCCQLVSPVESQAAAASWRTTRASGSLLEHTCR